MEGIQSLAQPTIDNISKSNILTKVIETTQYIEEDFSKATVISPKIIKLLWFGTPIHAGTRDRFNLSIKEIAGVLQVLEPDL